MVLNLCNTTDSNRLLGGHRAGDSGAVACGRRFGGAGGAAAGGLGRFGAERILVILEEVLVDFGTIGISAGANDLG